MLVYEPIPSHINMRGKKSFNGGIKATWRYIDINKSLSVYLTFYKAKFELHGVYIVFSYSAPIGMHCRNLLGGTN